MERKKGNELTGGAGAGRGEQIATLILAGLLVDDHVVQSDEILIVVDADRDESRRAGRQRSGRRRGLGTTSWEIRDQHRHFRQLHQQIGQRRRRRCRRRRSRWRFGRRRAGRRGARRQSRTVRVLRNGRRRRRDGRMVGHRHDDAVDLLGERHGRIGRGRRGGERRVLQSQRVPNGRAHRREPRRSGPGRGRRGRRYRKKNEFIKLHSLTH